MASHGRAYGDLLRRLAHGETLHDIDRDIRAMQVAARRIRADASKLQSIVLMRDIE